MIAGHFGLAAIVKSRETRVPLWSLMLGTVWLDILFVPLLLAKVESMQTVPGLPGGYGQNIIHADYTHSLIGAILCSAVFGLLFLPRWGQRCAAVLGLMAFSHWLLDLVVHRHDMPLVPGGGPYFGFGVWQYRNVSITAELVLVVLGAWSYWRAARVVADGPRARLVAGLILVFGILVLGLDVRG